MPPKNHKKVIASSGLFTQGHPGQVAEAIANSSDEFEHLAVASEDEDRCISTYFSFSILQYLCFFFLDSEEAIEICENEGQLDNDELALIPSRKKVLPSGSPIKASLVLFLFFIFLYT
jgi:hypothetical protein